MATLPARTSRSAQEICWPYCFLSGQSSRRGDDRVPAFADASGLFLIRHVDPSPLWVCSSGGGSCSAGKSTTHLPESILRALTKHLQEFILRENYSCLNAIARYRPRRA